MIKIKLTILLNIFIVLLSVFALGNVAYAVNVDLDNINAANATNAIDSLNFAQTWNWSTLSSQNAFSFNFNSITSGGGLVINSSSTGLTGSLTSITLSGSNASNTGNLLLLTQSGANSAAVPLRISNSGTGNSLNITSGIVPFVITSSGSVGIGTSSPTSSLHVVGTGNITGNMTIGGTLNGLTISTTTGTLTLANGSTLATSGANSITFTSTGATSLILPTSGTLATLAGVETLSNKTLVTPTIADFTNATHTHADSAGGGQLNATNIFSSGTIPTARLGSGTANSSTFLRGDQTWATLSASVSSTSGISSGPSSSSTQTITHGLGTTPQVIRTHGIGTMESASASRTPSMSFGIYNSSGNNAVYMPAGQGQWGPSTSTTFSVYLQNVGTVATGIVQNVGSTTFDIVWTTGGDLSNSSAFLWEAQ